MRARSVHRGLTNPTGTPMTTDDEGQFFLPLTHIVVIERKHSLVCIPDRTSAECELEKLRRKFREQFIRAVIRKDRASKRSRSKASTYTLRYVTREAQSVPLF